MTGIAQTRNVVVIVAAATSSMGIGKNGKLPWRLKGDMAYFKTITATASSGRQNAVIMGRKTWQSIPSKFRPLDGRFNIVLSSSSREELEVPEHVAVCPSFNAAMALLESPAHNDLIDDVFVIGGARLYEEALQSPRCACLRITDVDDESGTRFSDCDAFLPALPSRFHERVGGGNEQDWKTEDGVRYRFRVLDASPAAPPAAAMPPPPPALADITNDGASGKEGGKEGIKAAAPTVEGGAAAAVDVSEEMQYLDLCREIIENGVQRGDRTGTGTLSKFGAQMRFSLRDGRFPLLTSKRVFWRGVAEELLWFIGGRTDATELSDKNIHIWDGNGSREFLDGRGLHHRAEGDLGPVYGFQWRHFGAKYVDFKTDYTGQGVDQLAECINKIKNSPNDRRIILSAWNPADMDEMALPPCHMFCQFFVADGELSCQMYQRSADMGLGVPFNIASYALLTRLVAQVCDLEPGEFIHVIGDAHVYLNHVDALKEQLKREPRPFPTLKINPSKDDIDSFEFSDFTVDNYKPHPTIKMQMAV